MTAISTQPGSVQAAGPVRGGRAARMLRGRPGDPAWARPALAALLVATALLYLVGLSRNGWANEFYAGAAQAGTESWKAFLFGSLDSANFITVDKPAGFLWPMELSARIFGVNYWSLLLPQALAGVATVGVLYATVRRWFGPAAGIIAGAVMALAPVATLIFRFNDPDAFITLTAVLAAYAGIRALESGSTRWVVLTGVLFGLGFLGKMLAGFLALPALALAYLICGPPRLGKRIWQLLAGGAALLVTAGWWVAIVLFTPAASRPFVGSTTDNNILQLIFGYNGLSRLTGNRGGGGLGGAARVAGPGPGAGAFGGGAGGAAGPGPGGFGGAGGGRGFGGGALGGGTGITRMFTAEWGGQISWLIPAALIAMVVMLWVSRRAARTDRTRAAAIMWGGWLVVAGLVLSFMSGTTHSYYAIALAPPIGALTGIGAVTAWRNRHTWFARAALATALVVTAVWAWVLLGRNAGWFPWLRVVIVIAAVAGAVMILAGPYLRAATARRHMILAAVPVALAVIAGLGGPLAYSLDTAATSYAGTSPSAGPPMTGALGGPGGARGPGRGFVPGRGEFPGLAGGAAGERPGRAAGGFGGIGGFGGGGNASVSSAFARLLESGASHYTWAAATDGADSAASMELAAGGAPVMAIGGFRGSDPAPSLAQFEKLVSEHKIHYYVAGGGLGGRGFGGGFGGGLADRGPGGAGGDPAGRGAGGFGGFGGAGGLGGAGGPGGSSTDAAQISAWVQAHFTARTVG
ncbi:MAG TPA: glycosyltransferase family 39 protein, partial [Streptosporangiaceae bacterium]|nr:glycosyltransferase family 39 protein [Streptosporangiaceae bacterium]